MVPDAAIHARFGPFKSAPFPRDFRSIETEIGLFGGNPVPRSEKIHVMREGNAWR
jgi:hypothetical protein